MMRKGRVCQVQSSCSQHRGGSRNCYAVDLEFVDHTGLEAKLFTYAADDISGCQGAGKHLLELRGVGGSGPKKNQNHPQEDEAGLRLTIEALDHGDELSRVLMCGLFQLKHCLISRESCCLQPFGASLRVLWRLRGCPTSKV